MMYQNEDCGCKPMNVLEEIPTAVPELSAKDLITQIRTGVEEIYHRSAAVGRFICDEKTDARGEEKVREPSCLMDELLSTYSRVSDVLRELRYLERKLGAG